MGDRVTVSDRAGGGFTLAGELDAFGASLADGVLGGLPSGLDGHLDVSGLTFVDSAGLRVLVRLSERLRADGASLHLHDASDALRRLIELTGLDTAFVMD
ncbi:STAS domain-containing protein [Desertimonas flava]|uniref:STAS domain-containing protein n=1 Tax=Desertimonas flava TaxID=2064846 RepID=UPI0013C44234|nr:STAS domain-containing protein [Desertimonas flava]